MLPTLLLAFFAAVLAPWPALASPPGEPMRLDDPRPRWVGVRFEVSPADRPDQLDRVYTPGIRAWLEPDAVPGRLRVSIPGADVERMLLVGEDPVPGSFGSFVWVFDAASGHVVSAELRGTLIKTLDWGPFTSRVRTPIRVAMRTAAAAGFEPPRVVLGQRLHGFCERAGSPDCTLVAGVRYDRSRGYVNAVGSLAVEFRGITLRTFSPLGEARFSELPASGRDSDADPQIARQR